MSAHSILLFIFLGSEVTQLSEDVDQVLLHNLAIFLSDKLVDSIQARIVEGVALSPCSCPFACSSHAPQHIFQVHRIYQLRVYYVRYCTSCLRVFSSPLLTPSISAFSSLSSLRRTICLLYGLPKLL